MEKTSTKFRPPPAVTVRADATILECVRIMKRREVGAVLILNDTGDGGIVGIFTERDLLRRLDDIRVGNFWDKPIRTVMTRPVRTIEVETLEQAAEIMLQKKLRHLPVVANEKNKKTRLLGVVSIRDLLQMFLKQAKQPR